MKSFIVLLIAVFSLGAPGAKLLSDEQNSVEIYQRCNPAVVNITAVTLKQDFFFDIVPQRGAGSGAIIRADGYIVTNDHVVGNAQQVEVTLFDKSTFPAQVVGSDPDSDIAVIKIEIPKDRKLTTLDFAAPGDLAVGQKVLAIGNPFGLGGSLSVGVISSLGRDIRAPSERLIKDVIQTDAAINMGNSGGPLLDSSGKLIGINTQIVSASGGSDGIGFSISMETVRKVSGQLIQYGKVLRPELGLDGVGLSAALLGSLKIPSVHGVMVTDLDPKGLAAKAGLKPAMKELIYGFRRIPVGGDVITHIDESPVRTLNEILDAVYDRKVGESIMVHYLRAGKKRSVSIKLTVAASPRGKSL